MFVPELFSFLIDLYSVDIFIISVIPAEILGK